MQRQLLIVIAALVLVAPVTEATWRAWGTYEPDTAYDGSFMWTNPDTGLSNRIYFNGWAAEGGVVNPNNGVTGSQILVAGSRVYQAMLGVWSDCNRDGYVGMAETVAVSYRAELLLDQSACPPGSRHNDAKWIHEYIPIGYQHGETTPSLHPTQISDQDARVWADFGLPGARAATTCPIVPLPHGTTAGTGWALRYADCFVGKQGTGLVNTIDEDGSLGLRFNDQNNPQYSTSLLNRQLPQSLWGNPATGETGALQLDSEEDGGAEQSAFTAFDCSGRLVEVKDPTGLAPDEIVVNDGGAISGRYGRIDENLTDADGNYAWVATPAPNVNDPFASFADGLNGTFRGFRIGGGNENYDNTVGGDCDTVGDDQDGDNTYSGAHQLVFFYADGNHEGGTQFAGKNKQDVRFTYTNGAPPNGLLTDNSGPTHPVNAGLLQSSASWNANVNYVTPPQSIDRNTLKIQGGLYVTLYAKVGASLAGMGLAGTGAASLYGLEACGANDSGIHGGWECDPDLWYRDSNGNDIATVWDVRVGSPYQFRDVDCTDGEAVRGSGVFLSLAPLSDDPPCADAP